MKTTQMNLELAAKESAIGKFNASIENAIDTNNEFETSYGREVVIELFPHVEKFVKEQLASKGWGKIPLIKDFLKPSIATYTEELATWKANKIGFKPSEPVESFCYTMAVSIASTVSSEPTFTVAATRMSHVASRFFYKLLEDKDLVEIEAIEKTFISFFGRLLVEVAEHSSVFSVDQTFSDQYFLNVSIEWVEKIEEYRKNAESSAQEYGPMVYVPNKHVNLTSTHGGYLATPSPLLKRPSRVLGEVKIHPAIKAFNSTTQPLFFNYINKLQETPLCVNTKLLEVIKTLKEEGLEFSEYMTDLECYKEVVRKEYEKDMAARIKVRKDFAEFSGTEYEPHTEGYVKQKFKETRNKYSEKVKKTKLILEQCETYSAFENIYYPVFCDHRGRVYPYATYGLTPQGDELSKAMLQFANKKKLTVEGVDALYETLGNALGHDKKHLRTKLRIASEWFAEWNKTQDYTVFIKEEKSFDEPVNALAICLELVEYHNNPDYLCGYIAHRDARCSGTSIMSTILRDIKGMRLTSVTEHNVNTQALPDAYQACCNETYSIVKNAERYTALLNYENILFTRSNFKSPVMLKNYGGTYFGLKKKHIELFKEEELPREVAHLFTEATNIGLERAVPACIKFLDSINSVAVEVAAKKGELVYNNPFNNFPVVIQEFKEVTKKVKVQTSFKTIQLNLKTFTNEVNYKKLKSVSSPNIIHSLDSAMLFEVGSNVDYDVVFIHDSLGSHPNDCHNTVKTYAVAMHKLATNNAFDSIYKQLGTEQEVPYANTATAEDIEAIKDSLHILC